VLVFETLYRQIHHLHQSNGPQKTHLVDYPFWHADTKKSMGIAAGCVLVVAAMSVVGARAEGPSNFSEKIEDTERAIELIPGQSRLYVALAREAREKQDWQRHLALVQRAAALEGRTSVRLLHAFALWRADKKDEAVQTWKDIAAHQPTPRRLASDLARYVGEDTDLMAEIMADGDAESWRYAARELTTLRGRIASIQFALGLLDQRPQDSTPYELVIESYWSAEMWDVAELWSQYLILTGQATDEGPIGWGLYVDTLLRQGEREKAREAAADALGQVPGDPAISAAVMTLRSPNPTRAESDEIELVQKAYDHYCVAPLVGAKRKNCLRARAWLLETKDEIDEAEDIYRSLYESTKDARELGSFYLRQNRCVALRALAIKAEDAQKARIEKLYLRCTE